MKKRMTINNLGSSSAEVLLYDEIGGWFGIDAKQFATDIAELDVKDLTVRVHSPGGDVWDGLAIMNSLKRHKARITVVVEGMAASAASFIAAGAADELIMAPHSELMIHDAMAMAYGNAADLEATIEHLNRESENIASIYASRSGGEVDFWREAMRAESWYSASEAVTAGLADRIGGNDESADMQAFAHSRVMARFKNVSRKGANRPPIPTNRKVHEMSFLNDVAKRLGIDFDAGLDEGTVLAALEETLHEQAETLTPVEVDPAEKEKEELADDETVSPVEETIDDEDPLTVEIDAARLAELEEAEAKWKQAAAREAEEALEKIAAQAVADGKIGAAAKDRWVKALNNDPEDAKARLANMRAGTVHRSETGHVKEPETIEVNTNDADIKRALATFNLPS